MNEIENKINQLYAIKWKQEKEEAETKHKKYLAWIKQKKGKYFKRKEKHFTAYYKIISTGEYPEIAEVSIEDREIYITDYDADISCCYEQLTEVSSDQVIKESLELLESIIKTNLKIEKAKCKCNQLSLNTTKE